VNPRIGVLISLLLTAIVIYAPTARAQPYGGPPQGYYHPQWHANQHLRRAACASKSVGATCKVVLQGQTYGGNCQPTQPGGPLACRNLVNLRGQYGY
jgi:hypothetical protein